MTVLPFSPEGRASALERMAADGVDMLVVGGGITGAGLARDAALRGFRVGLVEKEDFGYGTSGRSTKIVHGGIRYLQYLHLRLVREMARERWALKRIAPHLVHPIPYVYPLYAGESKLKFRIGFRLFDALAGASRDERHRFLRSADVRASLPGLRDPLAGGVVYNEYVTDDARLTLENAMDAAAAGAFVANHAEAVGLVRQNGRVRGAAVRDRLTGEEREVAAGVVVNAGGPWAESVLRLGGLAPAKPLLISKGIHLLFSADRLPLGTAAHLKAPSGREGLAIRRWDYVYVGTSDVVHDDALDSPVADAAAVDDVLELVRACFPALDLGTDDILATWAGLRPLIREERKEPRETSRHDEVWPGPEGLITIAGGKLTTYMAMSERVMVQAARVLGRPPGDRAVVRNRPLPGARMGTNGYAAFCERALEELRRRGVAPAAAVRMVWLYGGRVVDLLRYGDEDADWLAPLADGFPAVRAEARLAAERELALDLTDFMDRRAALLIFSPGRGEAAAPEAAEIMGRCLGWDAAEKERQLVAYAAAIARHGLPGT